ncbi:MAG: metallopeptidase family protein [Candidatus Saganbacteria bacterium]|nr:metallopeptidase family protein [Candidatus Saganbacteria bacterium]
MLLSVFQQLLQTAITNIPETFREKLENITIEVEPDSIIYDKDNNLILGQYQGVPYTNRGPAYRNVMPDRIIIYKKAFDRFPEEKLADLIVNVLQHEIGHYFGMSEEELAKYKRI